MAGPIVFVPLARVFGTSPCIFWSLVGMLVTGIWSAESNHRTAYISFVLSRLFGGIFGAAPQVLGNGVIVDLFFLH